VLAAVLAAACSGKPRAEDAAHAGAARGDDAAGDGAPTGAAPTAPGSAAGEGSRGSDAEARPATPAVGDLQIRVEWPEVPAAARSSPGRTRCTTPRAPSVAPTTTWGIPEALVIVDGAGAASATAHVTLADCALAPRVAVGDRLAITSAVDRPARLALRKRGTLDALAPGAPVAVMLPIAGHTAAATLDAGAIYSLEADEPEPEAAFIAAVPGGFVTDATGHVLVRDLAAGAHAVTAWLPPRGGQPARIGHGTATVVAGELAELTVKLLP
jgi:hypothetical protein